MRKFQVLIMGRNFRLLFDGKERRMGFFTTCWVTAKDPHGAELKAVGLIRKDGWMRRAILNEPADPPMLYMDDLIELRSFGRRKPNTRSKGYTFFPDRGRKKRS